MDKKYLSKCLSVFMAVGVAITLSAYSYAQKGGTVSVLMCGTPQSDQIEKLAPEFTEETGIGVDLEIISYKDVHTKGVLDLVSGTAKYDVLMMDNPWLAEYVC